MERNSPLHGIRVLDFTWVTAGPMCTRFLAGLGAEVVKVESNTKLDLLRGRPPFAGGKRGTNLSAQFNNRNCGKLSITLNMRHQRAKEIVKKLVAISDIVCDNFTAHVMDRWGLDYAALREIKPDIIALSMPVMGKTGPRSDYGAFGPGVEALSGLKFIWGNPDYPPVGSSIAYPDTGPNPRHATVAVLAALYYRNRTGMGQFIELSQYESTVCFTGTAILDYTVNRRVQTRKGARHDYCVPHGAYPCKGDDRWCVLSVCSDADWRAFCGVIGHPAWTKEERFKTFLRRKQNEAELDRLVQEWTIQRTAEEVMQLMQQDGVAAGVVQTGEDLLIHDPQLKARENYKVVNHLEAGALTCDGLPFRLSACPEVCGPSPLLGEHNEYVYGKILSMSEEEINVGYVDGLFT